MKNEINFSAREKFLISYYRDPGRARSAYGLLDELFYMVAASALMVLSFSNDDPVYATVGCGLLLWRNIYNFVAGREYTKDLCRVFEKYEERLKELEADEANTPKPPG